MDKPETSKGFSFENVDDLIKRIEAEKRDGTRIEDMPLPIKMELLAVALHKLIGRIDDVADLADEGFKVTGSVCKSLIGHVSDLAKRVEALERRGQER